MLNPNIITLKLKQSRLNEAFDKIYAKTVEVIIVLILLILDTCFTFVWYHWFIQEWYGCIIWWRWSSSYLILLGHNQFIKSIQSFPFDLFLRTGSGYDGRRMINKRRKCHVHWLYDLSYFADIFRGR